MYKIIMEFQKSNILSINADDPNVAAQNIRKLFEQGRVTPQIKTIKVFNEEDDIYENQPLYSTDIFYE